MESTAVVDPGPIPFNLFYQVESLHININTFKFKIVVNILMTATNRIRKGKAMFTIVGRPRFIIRLFRKIEKRGLNSFWHVF